MGVGVGYHRPSARPKRFFHHEKNGYHQFKISFAQKEQLLKISSPPPLDPLFMNFLKTQQIVPYTSCRKLIDGQNYI